MGPMNELNRKLFFVPAIITLVYVAMCMDCTLRLLWSGSALDFCIFDPLEAYNSTNISSSYVLLSDLLPDGVWEIYVQIPNALLDLVGGYLDQVGRSDMSVIFMSAAFVMVLAGMFSRTAQNCTSGEDTREFMFTTRPHSILKALAMPWDIFPAMWSHKYVPILLPVFFLPFIIPIALISTILMLVFFLLEKLIMGLYVKSAYKKDKAAYDSVTGYAICPKCKMKFYQPNVRCKCGLLFDYPVPGVYGVKEHYCVNGHSVPCNNITGARGKLNMVCPHCGSDMITHEAKPTVISLIGAEGSGKTTLMVAAVESVCKSAKAKAVFTEVSNGISSDAYRILDVVPPTVAGELDSETLFMWSRDINAKELVLNDISGREFEPDEDRMLFQEYYKYTDGFIFTIDPMMVVHNTSGASAKYGKMTVMDVFDSFYQVYTTINGYGPSVVSDVPMAVVLTKMDNQYVRSAMGSGNPSPRDFLACNGQEDFVGTIESVFSNVRYFSVSSLGNNANPVEPVKWIVESRDKETGDLM